MKKAKQWDKPQVGVMTRGKSSKTDISSQKRNTQYYLGPAPAPPSRPEARYYLGPAPAPPSRPEARYYMGPAPAPPSRPEARYYLGPAPAPFETSDTI